MWRVGCNPILQRCGKPVTDIPTLRLEPHQPGRLFLDTTGFKGEVYADSSRETFRTLDLKVTLETTPKGEKKKSYLPNSMFVNVMASMWVSATHLRVLRISNSEHSVRLRTQHTSGDRVTSHNWAVTLFSDRVCEDPPRLDFVLSLSVGPQCSFAHRMQHTEDRKLANEVGSTGMPF